MFSVWNLWVVARYEMKTLVRGWFFRIFTGFSLLILLLYNTLTVSDALFGLWIFRAIPSSIPYANIMLLNLIQAIISVFLASDFLKRDKKLDTTEVVYMRSMTNGDYVLGKTIGILVVFMALNLVVFLIASTFNLMLEDTPLALGAYLYYPLLIALPSLLFIFGFSFLLMTLVRNQAVTFILLLGYIAATLFFLFDTWFNVFDYMGIFMPMLYSDFVGFGNPGEILLQRGIYLFLGISFISATIFMLKRLPQSTLMTRISLISSIGFFIGGLLLGGFYYAHKSSGATLRNQMRALNEQNADEPTATITSFEIDVVHAGSEIQNKAQLTLVNRNSEPLNSFIFSLNPGLVVQAAQAGGVNLKHDRDLHLLKVTPENALQPGAQTTIALTFSGRIDEEACYLDIDEETRSTRKRVWLYNLDKRYAFLNDDFVLLTPETMWYPVAGVRFNPKQPEAYPQAFASFSVKVTTKKGLTALSQGESTTDGAGNFTFSPEVPLPHVSLVIGDYEKRALKVDAIEYKVLSLKGHDYFTPHFNLLADTLPSLIRGIKEDFEREKTATYPYSSLALVEVPIQFESYPRLWGSRMETVQPGIVFMPEKGAYLASSDFRAMIRGEEKRNERRNEHLSPAEVQANAFRRFTTSTFMRDRSGNAIRRAIMMGSGGRNNQQGGTAQAPTLAAFLPSILREILPANNHKLGPNYYEFVNHIESKKWPILNAAIAARSVESTENLRAIIFRMATGISDAEKTNAALGKSSFTEILTASRDQKIRNDAFQTKGRYLLSLIESQIGKEEFQSFITKINAHNRFRTIDFETFARELQAEHNFDLTAHIDAALNSTEMPGFELTNMDGYKIVEDNRERFQVLFTLSNLEPAAGLVTVSIHTGGRGRRMRLNLSEPSLEKTFFLAGNEHKDIGFVFDDRPLMMTANTHISKNIPATLRHNFERFQIKKGAKAFSGERSITPPADSAFNGEVIVDNDDSGFHVLNIAQKGFISALMQKEGAEDLAGMYQPMRLFNAPSEWAPTTNADFHGRVIRSAWFARGGKGDKKVEWVTVLPEAGTWEVFSYISKPMNRIMGRRNRNRNRNNNNNRNPLFDKADYQYFIHHDDGTEETVLQLKDVDVGWNSLGSFYFSSDTARVIMSNKSKGRLLVADAVKWVKQ